MSGTEVSAVHRALNNLFTTLSPEQVQKFLSEMSVANTAAGGVAASNGNGQSIQETSEIGKPVVSDSIQATVVSRPSSRGKRSRENGKLRPLNSFIAFRSFYSAAFPDLSQKVKSGLLRFLWTSDPFKGKWAILAKAYSTIRDKHLEKVNLETFLALNGPFIGIVPASEYLEIMGLQLTQSLDKQYSLLKTKEQNLTVFDLTTNLSADDVVDYCYQTGYVQGIIPEKKGVNDQAALTMAVTAQPNSTIITSKPTAEVSIPKLNDGPADATVGATTDMMQVEASTSKALIIHPAVANNAITLAQTLASNAASNNSLYTAADFEQELRDVMNAFPFDAEDDGYYGLFNPALKTPVVVYHPYRIQGDFDPFDITAHNI